ncbi:MAG: aldo/keto reductase [Betaproteobacteria bacterium]|nr:aldo/keto reductase [Betaproteobacteria bacterium]
MIKRKLGDSGFEVAPLAFGGNVFGWSVNEAESFRLLDAFLEAGFNLIDTADVYSNWVEGNSGGESETIIGRWMTARGNRNRVVLVTKVGWKMTEEKKGLAPDYMLEAIEGSLRRLQTDHIDIYMSHIDDPKTPQQATLETYARLIREGKVRAIGASQFSAARLREATQLSRDNGLPRYEVLEPGFNLLDRSGYEGGLEAVCRELGLGVIPYAALARGFLTGKYRSEADLTGRARAQWARQGLNERGLRILAAQDEIAARCKATPAQVALAWLMARPGITAPIAGATSLAQLDELMDAARLALDAAAIEQLNRASA